MEESHLETIMSLPDWKLAVKAVPGTLGKVTTTTTTNRNDPTLGEAEGDSSINCFMEAMSLLIQIQRAFGTNIASEEIKKLVDAFTEKIVSMYTSAVAESSESSLLKLTDFSCPSCFEVLEEPHTLLCGHSYCNKCLQKESVGNQCRLCSYRFNGVDIADTRPNVLVMSIAEKLWPKNKRTVSLRNEGNELFKQNNLEEALLKYTQAIELSMSHHLSVFLK